MSTVAATNLKNASSSVNNAVTTSGGDLTNAAGVSFMGGSKNLLYNGAMQVAQRGTSVASISAGGNTYRTADRWQTNIDGGLGTWTQSVENDGPSGTGITKSLKMLCTGTGTPGTNDQLSIAQILEGQDVQRVAKGTASAKQLTLSFWVKSNVTGTYTILFYDVANNRSVGATYTISASATWEQKSVTFAADSSGAVPNTSDAGLAVYFSLGAGSGFKSGAIQSSWGSYSATNRAVGQVNVASATNNYWQITGVQLEVGPVATSFEFKSYGQELRECQRYYQTFAAFGVAGYASGASESIMGTLPFNGEMRANPTVTITNNGTTSRLSSVVVQNSSSRSAIIQVIATGAGFCGIYGGTTATAAIEL